MYVAIIGRILVRTPHEYFPGMPPPPGHMAGVGLIPQAVQRPAADHERRRREKICGMKRGAQGYLWVTYPCETGHQAERAALRKRAITLVQYRLGIRAYADTSRACGVICKGSTFSRSEERGVGKECVSTCRSGVSPYH